MEKFLIIGSSGMLGTAMLDVLKKKARFEIIPIYHTDCEISDYDTIETILNKYNPDYVLNCVAIIGVDICEKSPVKCLEVNSESVKVLAKLCNKLNITLIQPSSHAVFDGLKDNYYTEEDIPKATNIYGLSKLLAEVYVKTLCKKHYIIRLPTMFGKRRNSTLGFTDKIIDKIKKGEQIKGAVDKIDSFTYSIDACEQILFMIEQEVSYGIYHIANDGRCSYYHFIKKIADLLSGKVDVIPVNDSEFPSLGYKPLRTSLTSVKLPRMRYWENALEDFLFQED